MSEISVQTLVSRITNVIEIHQRAEDVTVAEVIGVLECIKLDLYRDISEGDMDED